MHRATGLTVEQICRITGATPNTVRGWIHRGHLTRNEWGLVDADDVRAYLESRQTLATPASACDDEGHVPIHRAEPRARH